MDIDFENHEKATILIVDDLQDNRLVVQTILNTQNYKTITTDNGKEALELAESNNLDLILLDIMMPVMDGFEVCTLLKSNPATKSIPIIFLSALSEVESIVKGFDLGAVDYIIKPFNKKELLVRTRNHLAFQFAMKELERMVVIDGLTQLYNHKFIIERLEQEIAHARRHNRHVSVILLDIDNFKNVNDCYGHQAGDEVLVRVSEIIQQSIRETDIPGRYGGEEFLIVFPETENDKCLLVAEKIRLSIQNNDWGDIVGLTISGGIATLKDETARKLITKADKLLYKAKNAGRNQIMNKH